MGRKWDATTLILMTLAVAVLGIKDFIMTLSINGINHNETQRNVVEL
jgi:hypothetical protein